MKEIFISPSALSLSDVLLHNIKCRWCVLGPFKNRLDRHYAREMMYDALVRHFSPDPPFRQSRAPRFLASLSAL